MLTLRRFVSSNDQFQLRPGQLLHGHLEVLDVRVMLVEELGEVQDHCRVRLWKVSFPVCYLGLCAASEIDLEKAWQLPRGREERWHRVVDATLYPEGRREAFLTRIGGLEHGESKARVVRPNVIPELDSLRHVLCEEVL